MSNIDEFFEIIRHEYNKHNIELWEITNSKVKLDEQFEDEVKHIVFCIKRLEKIRELKREADRARN